MTLLLQIIPSETELYESSITFLSRFAVNFTAVFILIRFIYYRHYHRTDLFLTFFSFNVVIFLITYLLNKVEMSMGAAFGLFAIFSILRYRTEGLSAKDVTYLFLSIALGLITAISKGSWLELGFLAAFLISIIAILEGDWLIKKEQTRIISYDKINLIVPEKSEELLADLTLRTGLNIHRVEILNYDFLKDATQLMIFYFENKKSTN